MNNYIFKDGKYYHAKLTEISPEIILELLNDNLEDRPSQDYIQIWKYKVCKENLKAEPNWKDIWEKYWKCYFTQKATIRETEKQGLILPTIEEWWEIMKEINPNIDLNKWWQDDISIRTKLWLELSGYRNTDGDFYSQGSNGNYWSSTPYDSTDAFSLAFNSSFLYPASYYYRTNGFSVRCLKN